MTTRLTLAALGLAATALLTFGALGSVSPVAAGAEPQLESAEAALASGDHTRLPYWLKNSIIVCAADTIGVRVQAVKAALRQGHSLKEIAARYDVPPNELKRGILDCERRFLYRLVLDGKLTRSEAARIYNFIEEHIERIINFHYQPDDGVLQEAVSN